MHTPAATITHRPQEDGSDAVGDGDAEGKLILIKLPKAAFIGERLEFDSEGPGCQLFVTQASSALSAAGVTVGAALVSIDMMPSSTVPKEQAQTWLEQSPADLVAMEVRLDPAGYKALVDAKVGSAAWLAGRHFRPTPTRRAAVRSQYAGTP